MSDLMLRNMKALVEAAKADRVRVDELIAQQQRLIQANEALKVDIAGLRTQVIGLLARVNGNGRTA